MHEIIANATKAVQAGRWVSIDQAQPNTVPHGARRAEARGLRGDAESFRQARYVGVFRVG
eukprot:8653720-Lingulodinium_polyedra.AAC.1